jgi:glycosyltransferase involved in cell wall biosynthesis
MADYLGACDVFVLPTRIEGSCNSVIEAMACGLPVITASGRHMDDIVDDDTALRVDPADAGAIRAAILALRDDPDRRRRMAAADVAKAKTLELNKRARRVTAWLESVATAGGAES